MRYMREKKSVTPAMRGCRFSFQILEVCTSEGNSIQSCKAESPRRHGSFLASAAAAAIVNTVIRKGLLRKETFLNQCLQNYNVIYVVRTQGKVEMKGKVNTKYAIKGRLSPVYVYVIYQPTAS